MTDSCFMCGNAATHRLSPDLDIKGIALCDSLPCKHAIHLFLMDDNPAYDLLDRWRKRLHKDANNKYTKA